MKLKLLLILTALLTATSVLAGNEDDEVKKVAGSWLLGFDEKLSIYKLVIKDDKTYSWKDKSGVENGTLSIDPAKSPLAIDFHVTLGRLKGKTRKGIYKVDKVKMTVNGRSREVERLTTCIAAEGAERPSGFNRDQGAVTAWLR
jgi:uncharacterized protein (TIGR03067 family)